jgi:two-component system response regulator AtoC
MRERTFKIFVVEDNEWYNKLLMHCLALNPDYEIVSFTNGTDMMKEINQNPNVITLDYRLPDGTGEEYLRKIKAYNPSINVVIISEQEEIETAVELLKGGAYDYIVKTKDIRDRLISTINHIRDNFNLKTQLNRLQNEIGKKYSFEKTLIGESMAIKSTYELMSKAVGNNITVSITGETGTGKEVVAKAIHYNSNRREKALVAVNMAAIPAELIESELFGHEKGAFTGATTRRKGKFEEADGGTLFLDEMGEMDKNSQSKLLRALQEKEITRVGGNETIKVDCRIIIATNRDLAIEVEEGNFREDLYYRLFGLPIHLAPLRERENDVILLAKFFMEGFCKENEISKKSFTEKSIAKMKSYTWPGNIRELKSVIDLACVMSNDDTIDAENITLINRQPMNEILHSEMTMREYEQKIIGIYMEKYDKNTKLMADKLDISQTTIYRLLKEIEKSDA